MENNLKKPIILASVRHVSFNSTLSPFTSFPNPLIYRETRKGQCEGAGVESISSPAAAAAARSAGEKSPRKNDKTKATPLCSKSAIRAVTPLSQQADQVSH